MDREQILLKEYETCQSHINSMDSQSWVSFSILISVNLLLIGQVVYNLVKKSAPINGHAELMIVIGLGVAALIILFIFKHWHKRIRFMVLLNRERMRTIETRLEMWKNWRVYGLDLFDRKEKCERNAKEEWRQLLLDQQKYIERLKKKTERGGIWKYIKPSKFECVFTTLAILWTAIIILENLVYYCPLVRQCLLG